MAKSRLHRAARAVGAAVGRADRTAHKVVKAGGVAREELAELRKQVQVLARQLQKTSKRIQKALK